jgi:hypothetical protein
MTAISIVLIAEPVSVALGDSTGAYGVIRNDTLVTVIPYNTPMTRDSALEYHYTFDDPVYDLEYSYSVKVEVTPDSFEFVTGTISGDGIVEEELAWVSRLDAETYFKDRLWVTAWEGASDKDRDKSLIMATNIVAKLALYDFTEVPQDLKNAICEIALSLLDGTDPEKEFENLALTSTQYSSVRSTYDRAYPMEHLEAGVPSITAWRLIKPYLDAPKGLKLSRVS